mmetsp:Transcript_25025/g.79557  ORF Transcript_25025/g.79557 Transcript_25025/m.79557 type:complete len:277 (+) Transcript_25025:755-1585(+)
MRVHALSAERSDRPAVAPEDGAVERRCLITAVEEEAPCPPLPVSAFHRPWRRPLRGVGGLGAGHSQPLAQRPGHDRGSAAHLKGDVESPEDACPVLQPLQLQGDVKIQHAVKLSKVERLEKVCPMPATSGALVKVWRAARNRHVRRVCAKASVLHVAEQKPPKTTPLVQRIDTHSVHPQLRRFAVVLVRAEGHEAKQLPPADEGDSRVGGAQVRKGVGAEERIGQLASLGGPEVPGVLNEVEDRLLGPGLLRPLGSAAEELAGVAHRLHLLPWPRV